MTISGNELRDKSERKDRVKVEKKPKCRVSDLQQNQKEACPFLSITI